MEPIGTLMVSSFNSKELPAFPVEVIELDGVTHGYRLP